jgi:hypothetical protein
MITVTIPYSKFIELYKMISDPLLGTLAGEFNKQYKTVYAEQHLGNSTTLFFENEQDAVWFRLKYL